LRRRCRCIAPPALTAAHFEDAKGRVLKEFDDADTRPKRK
jgi:hypothetical protein